MSDNSIPARDLKAIWKGQPREIRPLTPETVRRNARRLQRRRLYIVISQTLGGIVLIVMSGFVIWIVPSLLLKIGYGLIILYAVFWIWRIFVLLRPRRVPDDTAACLEFHQRELERQRDIARNIWRWTIVPFLPVAALILVGLWIMPAPGRAPWFNHLIIIAETVILLETCVLSWLWNQHRADRWQDQIDELGAPGKETP